MLKCEKCGVEILCRTNVCPLCHERLDTTEENKKLIAKAERAFPIADPKRRPLANRFSLVYAIVAFILLVTLLPLNLIFLKDKPWILVVGAFLLYFYFLVRSTLLTSKAFHSRIFGQAVSLTAISLLVDLIFDDTIWIYEYVVPLICFSCLVTLCIYVLLNLRGAMRYMLTITVTALIGFIPIAVLLIFRELKPVFWPAAVTAALSGGLIIVSVCIAGKRMVADIRRFLHI